MRDDTEDEIVSYYGGAKPGDDAYADVRVVDGEIVAYLRRRERRRTRRQALREEKSMLSLSDHQLKVVMSAARMLPLSRRSPFLRSIGGRLCDRDKPSDRDVQEAIAFVLSCYGLSVPHRARAG